MTRWYTIKGGGMTVQVQRGEEPPSVTDGYGGWEVIARPHRVGYTHWAGHNPYRMKIPALFDGWLEGRSVEEEIKKLNAMALPGESGEPPVVDIIGATPLQGVLSWVIESLDWGTNVIWSEHTRDHPAYRRRQDVVINLLQYKSAVGIKKKPVGGRPQGKKPFYIVKKGDTLRKISAKMYGSQKWWRDIAKANKIRDPKKLKRGRKLRIP
jgi:hypothetical protein